MNRVTRRLLFISYNEESQDQPWNIPGLVLRAFVLACLFEPIDPDQELDHRERIKQ